MFLTELEKELLIRSLAIMSGRYAELSDFAYRHQNLPLYGEAKAKHDCVEQLMFRFSKNWNAKETEVE